MIEKKAYLIDEKHQMTLSELISAAQDYDTETEDVYKAINVLRDRGHLVGYNRLSSN